MTVARYVFGPVASGRLGRSLGIDPIGARICSFDCLYCEAGTTQALTAKRRSFVPAETILEELAAWKAQGHELPDVITFSGMGEPSLSTECGRIIAGAKALFPQVPLAVLTNASLLADPAVRRDLADADMVLPSLDSLVETEFIRLNRPHESVRLEDIRNGLLAFRREYRGLIFLEVLLVDGINDSDDNLAALTEFCAVLKPDRVDVVTVSRPAAYSGIAPAGAQALARFRAALGGQAPLALPTNTAANGAVDNAAALAHRIEVSIARRPQTAAAIAAALDVPFVRIDAALAALETQGRARRHVMGTETFFLAPRP